MPVQYQIEEAWLEHEGGTKFYHPIRLMRMSSEGTKVVTALHYAGFRGDYTAYRRPVAGGQVNIKAEDVYHSQITAKKKKGYALKDGAFRLPEKFPSSEEEFRSRVITMFGRSHADEIFVGLGMLPGDAHVVTEVDEADLRPSTPGDHIPVDELTERPAAWGSW